MRPTHLALIGAGGFGLNHLAALHRLEAAGVVCLRAVADPALASLAPQVDGLLGGHTRRFACYHEMLASVAGLEGVIVCTPIHLHKEMSRELLRLGLHVYLEKPPVLLLEELRELIARDPHERVAVGFLGVIPEVVQAVAEALRQQRLGELRQICIGGIWPRPSWYYKRTAWAGRLLHCDKVVFDGPATNAMSHYVHLASYLAGAREGGHATFSWLEAELYRARPIEGYDVSCLRGCFENGVGFSMALSHAASQRMEVAIRLEGTHGSTTLEFGREAISCGLTPLTTAPKLLLDHALRDFVARIRTGSRYRTTLRDCTSFLEIVGAMWGSSGGIHSLPAEGVRREREEPDTLFTLPGLEELTRQTLETGVSFAEAGAPWAIRPRRVTRAEALGFDLRAALYGATTPLALPEGR